MAQGLLQNLSVNLPATVEIPGLPKVNLRQIDKVAQNLADRATEVTFDLLVGVAVLSVGWVVSQWIAGWTQRALIRAHVEETLAAFLGSMFRYMLFLAAVMVALRMMGLGGTTLVALFGAFGLAMAFALRNTLSHLAAGLMLMVNRPFRVGDYVGVETSEGTVKRITLFNTEINTLSNIRIFIPNTKIWESVLTNHTYNAQRMIEFEVQVDPKTDSARLRQLLNEVIGAEERILTKPEPFVGADVLVEGYGAKYIMRLWVRTTDYSAVRYTLLDSVRAKLAEAGISLAVPRQQLMWAEPPVVQMQAVDAPRAQPTERRKAERRQTATPHMAHKQKTSGRRARPVKKGKARR